jgi:hypothetical protein
MAAWLAVCVMATLLLTRYAKRNNSFEARIYAWIAALAALATIAIYVVVTWPTFDMTYHTYHKVGGTITDIKPRGIAEGNGTTFDYAVQFGSDQTYRCDDSRCAVLKDGDTLALWCIPQWQMNATAGYACNYASSHRMRVAK